MIKLHYTEMFRDDEAWRKRAEQLSSKTYELTTFLVDILNKSDLKIAGENEVKVTYQDSCAGLRELNIKHQPRVLLNQMPETALIESSEAETCCGFGGLFCIKYPEISENIVDIKVDDILKTNAEVVIGGDLGCIMNIEGRISRRGEKIKVCHIAEYLVGLTDNP